MANGTASQNDPFFSSLIADIKSYNGKDPLLPWLRGIKKMRESLPPQLLQEKLPRFLQKCALTFENDKRYRNDVRYLRVWIHLMDYVDEPKGLLKAMERNRIGMKRALFYQAYALYYERVKRYEEAENMYRLGVQNLAEPIAELQKSYEQFLLRMERHKSKRVQRQEGRSSKKPSSVQCVPLPCKSEEHNENICSVEGGPRDTKPKGLSQHMIPAAPNKEKSGEISWSFNMPTECDKVGALSDSSDVTMSIAPSQKMGFIDTSGSSGIFNQQGRTEKDADEPQKSRIDDAVVAKFVDTAIVGKSEAEDARHHGLVEPTINMKEAMNDINSMFREPMDLPPVRRRSQKNRKEEDNNIGNGFSVFVDDNSDNSTGSSHLNEKRTSMQLLQNGFQANHEPLQVFVDDDEGYNGAEESKNMQGTSSQSLLFDQTSNSGSSAFVFPSPKDLSSENSDDVGADKFPQAKLREDTVVRRFVGSAILDEPVVENVWHHGLVDPTINLKEAMEDINSMFGKPIDFVRPRRSRKQEKAPERAIDNVGFSILADDDLEHQDAPKASDNVGFSILADDDSEHQNLRHHKPSGKANIMDAREPIGGFSILPDDDLAHEGQSLPKSSRENDLFEQTICTKEAMDEINKMFGIPLDF